MSKLLALFLATALTIVLLNYQFGPVRHGPGVLVARAPRQGPPTLDAPWEVGAWKYRALASYEIEARILSRRSYRRDPFAEICDLDLALGWNRLSDSAVLDQLKIWQEGRFFWWKTRSNQLPLARAELESSVANTHVIPGSPRTADALGNLRVGQLVRLRGQLVEARKADGTVFRSSLRRDDTGKGACEILWVESVDLLPGKDQ